MNLMTTAAQIAQILLETKAVKISIDPPFTWTSGITSPIYCDNRILISFPGKREAIVNAFCELVKPLKPDCIAGTATAGIPWASFVAYELDLPMVYVRPEPKAHGVGKQIEGYLPEGQKVVLVEDLISTGGSSIKVAKVLQEQGKADVISVLAIVTYEMAASKKTFEEAKIPLTTLTNFTSLLDEVKKQGYLDESQVKTVLEFSKDPPGWWSKLSLRGA